MDYFQEPNHVMICLLAASAFGWPDTEMESFELDSMDPPTIKKADTSINALFERAVNQYHHMVRKNNGIKEPNLKRLLVPVGVALSELDQAWLNTMNSFGSDRGLVAHNSRLGVTAPLDPRTEKDTVDILLVGLK